MDLKENERIDDLEYKGLKIIQNENYFCFGMDSILLSDFAKDLKKDSNILDIGTGTGIISILLSKKTECKKIFALEVQKEISEMAGRSVKLNDLENTIEIINDNIKNIEKYLDKNSLKPSIFLSSYSLLFLPSCKLVTLTFTSCPIENLSNGLFILATDISSICNNPTTPFFSSIKAPYG